ncbi:hypothetical protein BU25DRAFT_412043 [Macroventuria anomochaeta]|uniref:Uncharacterized protein n=1 Tax=Macroventuria anomochaeta TaxID=301207 RepID=A0ACB6RWN8_9PLEO|nr:uncharacterized protein BU25DRAFT_412043 [Macroventuria anomochaeta]KAF2626208.1 hypothetical protein BU25DRAFT_412043 [Macroventuria anomochaeta]
MQEHATLPVTVPLSTWRGDSFSRSFPSSLSVAIFDATASAKKWRIDGLTIQELDMLAFSTRDLGADSDNNLTSITIRLSARDKESYPNVPRAWLALFLSRWYGLESICLEFRSRVLRENGLTTSIRKIQDTFEVSKDPLWPCRPEGPVTWTKLRKLSLCHFDSTPKALLSLITRHSSTLRDLRLNAIWLDGEGSVLSAEYSWREIFRSIRATTSLEKVALSGVFRNNSHEDDVWDFNNEGLAKVVASWITNGAECPLTDNLDSV